MSLTVVLDIAIGLALMYLVLSLACTAINEVIATLASLRARSLKSAVEQLLDDPTLRAAFYKNGLISSSSDIVEKTGIVGSEHPSYIPSRTFALSLLASLDTTSPIPQLQNIKDSIEKLPANTKIRSVLLAQLADAGTDLDKLRTNVATWFDDAMGRVSGVYTRKVKLISFLVGLILAVVLNADTVRVGSTLWSDADLRAQLVETARTYAVASQPPLPPTGNTPNPEELSKRIKAVGDAIKTAQ